MAMGLISGTVTLAIQLSLSELKRREVVLGNEVLWGQSPWKTWTWC